MIQSWAEELISMFVMPLRTSTDCRNGQRGLPRDSRKGNPKCLNRGGKTCAQVQAGNLFSLEICFVAQEKMRIQVENKLIMSQQCTHVTKQPIECWAALEKCPQQVKRGEFTPLYSSLQFQ